MADNLRTLFEDGGLVEKIQRRLPEFFEMAELESSRAGRIGMEVGSVRESIIVALLIHKFGKEAVETEIPITKREVDALLNGDPISIKTITGERLGGVKIIWTVDAEKARVFRENYYPSCDILLVQINWGGAGGFYHIPLTVQERIFNRMGRNSYIRLPIAGTNPRGVEFDPIALRELATDDDSRMIEINWEKRGMEFNRYRKWIELWEQG